MLSLRSAAVLFGAAVLLAGCTPKPEQSIEKDCVRLNLFSEINAGADTKKGCACLAGKVKESMSKDDLKALAKMLKNSKTTDDFETQSKENGLSDASAMTFMGAAKSCALE
jgi:hypothetical protein